MTIPVKTKPKSSAIKGAVTMSFDDPAAHKEIVPANPSHVEVGYLEGDWAREI
jgi:hypothetical protein